MDVLEELMKKRKWIKCCLRANVAQPEDVKVYGTINVAATQLLAQLPANGPSLAGHVFKKSPSRIRRGAQ